MVLEGHRVITLRPSIDRASECRHAYTCTCYTYKCTYTCIPSNIYLHMYRPIYIYILKTLSLKQYPQFQSNTTGFIAFSTLSLFPTVKKPDPLFLHCTYLLSLSPKEYQFPSKPPPPSIFEWMLSFSQLLGHTVQMPASHQLGPCIHAAVTAYVLQGCSLTQFSGS